MDGTTFRESVEASKRTELDRLGSSKLLIALTGARIERPRVLEVAAHSEHAARETFRAWAADESHPEARAAFEAVAAQEDEHLDRVLDALDGDVDLADGGPMHAYLRGREDTVERVASGMVGRPLVSIRAHNQLIGFFVNEADEVGANLFRDLKTETAAVIDDGVALLDELCGDDADWERAEMVAEYVIQVAYDDYADSLTEMGLGVKDIC
ncbi:rubrerythrin family protein [Salinigranum halophilum]|uniref:rubrerythrin family protein n=1 Tax=Salinigranum halophilum TaxID=2565931 RepID=UPI0010A89533|nr:rubrerythrin family protein [Salinigranum halophilum]